MSASPLNPILHLYCSLNCSPVSENTHGRHDSSDSCFCHYALIRSNFEMNNCAVWSRLISTELWIHHVYQIHHVRRMWSPFYRAVIQFRDQCCFHEFIVFLGTFHQRLETVFINLVSFIQTPGFYYFFSSRPTSARDEVVPVWLSVLPSSV